MEEECHDVERTMRGGGTGAKGGEAEWVAWGVGGMSPLPHLSHAQMFEEKRWRIGGLGPEQGSGKTVKETTPEGGN